MSNSFANDALQPQGETVDLQSAAGSTGVDLLGLVRRAMSDTSWTQEALSLHMGKDPSYVSKVLSRDKPLGVGFLLALPEDLHARFAQLHAECFGLIVVAPVRGDDAIRQFAAGLIGLLAPHVVLPAKKKMAQAGLPATAKRKVG